MSKKTAPGSVVKVSETSSKTETSTDSEATATPIDAPVQQRLRYRLLTGPDTRVLCERVSAALDDGYELYGSPAMTFDGTTTYVAQAVVLPAGVS